MLSAVTSRGAYANLLLAASLRERGLSGPDAALATELVYGTLRGLGSYDAIIGLCSDRGLDRIDAPVREVLRLGVHQLLGMRMKPHAAVATSVDLAAEVAGRRPAGFVNAVLRRVTAHDLAAWIAIVAPDRAADPIGYLSIRYSHPRWIVEAIAEALGEVVTPARAVAPAATVAAAQVGGPAKDGPAGDRLAGDGLAGDGLAGDGLAQTEAALAADADRPVVTLAAVPGLCLPDELMAAGAITARWSPFGAYLPHGDPGQVAAVGERRAGVQDEASQLAALAVTRAPAASDLAWLDLCAGPGGKARLLAGLAAARGAVLVAADAHEHRARLAAEATSCISAARAVTADGTVPPWRAAAFDRVLADVPCSGLGSLRRRPEARWRRGPGEIADLAALQRRLLTAAVESARPGGIVAYVTCSPHVAETRDVVGDVVGRRGDVEVLDAPGLLAEVPDLRCPEPFGKYAQFWPHRHGTDAIFLTVLRRTSAA